MTISPILCKMISYYMNVLTNSDSMDYPYNLDDPGPAAQAAVCRLRPWTKLLGHMARMKPADWPCHGQGVRDNQRYPETRL